MDVELTSTDRAAFNTATSPLSTVHVTGSRIRGGFKAFVADTGTILMVSEAWGSYVWVSATQRRQHTCFNYRCEAHRQAQRLHCLTDAASDMRISNIPHASAGGLRAACGGRGRSAPLWVGPLGQVCDGVPSFIAFRVADCVTIPAPLPRASPTLLSLLCVCMARVLFTCGTHSGCHPC